jgi:hypothetical protein
MTKYLKLVFYPGFWCAGMCYSCFQVKGLFIYFALIHSFISGFKIVYADLQIKFRLYSGEAPIMVNAFVSELPFIREFMHARVSGQEIWANKGVGLNIIQENASVFTIPGEVVSGPMLPKRTRTSDCIGKLDDHRVTLTGSRSQFRTISVQPVHRALGNA